MSVAVEQAGIDYHVVLAQNALQQCLDHPELQSECICALVKQTSRHTQHRLGVQVKKAARLVSLGTARVVSPAYCLTKKQHSLNPSCTIFDNQAIAISIIDHSCGSFVWKLRISFSLFLYLSFSHHNFSHSPISSSTRLNISHLTDPLFLFNAENGTLGI